MARREWGPKLGGRHSVPTSPHDHQPIGSEILTSGAGVVKRPRAIHRFLERIWIFGHAKKSNEVASRLAYRHHQAQGAPKSLLVQILGRTRSSTAACKVLLSLANHFDNCAQPSIWTIKILFPLQFITLSKYSRCFSTESPKP
jgi:hypothetical protein